MPRLANLPFSQMRAFHFEKALMEEHFNESYVESESHLRPPSKERLNHGVRLEDGKPHDVVAMDVRMPRHRASPRDPRKISWSDEPCALRRNSRLPWPTTASTCQRSCVTTLPNASTLTSTPHSFHDETSPPHVLSQLLSWSLGLMWVHDDQPSLLDALNEAVEEPTLPVSATFKDTRIVNVQQRNPSRRGAALCHCPSVWHLELEPTTLGFGQCPNGMAFDYGITDRFAVGVARNTYQKTYEANVKARLLRQSTGSDAFPLSVTWYSVAMANGLRVSAEEEPYPFTRRMSYVHQAVLARKMSEDLSIAVIPSFVHRNFVESSGEAHDLFLVGFGGRYKLGPRFSLNGEYHHFLTPTFGDAFSPSLSLGVDIETGTRLSAAHHQHAGCLNALFSRSPWAHGVMATCILGSI